jgi:5'-3' exonuclease
MIDRIDTEGQESTICLIDGDSLLYYEMDKPTLEEALKGIDSRVETILTNCNANAYVGFLTGKSGYRYQVSPTYKANRKYRPKPIIFYALREYLKQRYTFVEFEGLEADDLVAYYGVNNGDYKVVICSPDKDVLHQCIGKHFNYQKVEFVTTSETDAEKFLWKQVLMGDSTDNIQGIPGVGIKTAENWLKDREKEIEGFVLRKYVEKFGVVEGLEQFFINFRLVYLLKTKEDVLRETKLELPELQSLICINSKPEENEPTESAPESPPWETW